MILIRFIISLLMILFCNTVVWATPSITLVSGTMTNGSSVVISGSNFGTKSPASPVSFLTFESGTPGDDVSESGWTLSHSDDGGGQNVSDNPKYSTAVLRTNSIKSVVHDMVNGYNSSLVYDWVTPPNPQKFYVNYWRYDAITGLRNNFKPLRWYGNMGGSHDDPQAFFTTYSTISGQMVIFTEAHAYLWEPYLSIIPSINTWYNHEEYLNCGTQGNTDSEYYVWVDGSEIGTHMPTGTGICLTGTARVYSVFIGHYFDRSLGGTLVAYTDNVYLDITQARVMIGDASTWATCTHREIQYPTAWASGEATITVNRGSFSASDTAYLYVVDSTGTVNTDGYPIKFGGVSMNLGIGSGMKFTGAGLTLQ